MKGLKVGVNDKFSTDEVSHSSAHLKSVELGFLYITKVKSYR